MNNPHKWTNKEINFIKMIATGKWVSEITEEFNKHFRTDLKSTQVRSMMKNRKIQSGMQNVKGKRPSFGRMQETQFKKGREPDEVHPIGYERVDRDGYVLIKVRKHGKWNERWKYKQRVVWEEVNGPVPEGHRLVFLDGNPLNCDISNLMLLSYEALGIMKGRNLFSEFPELNKVGAGMSKLLDAINKRTKEEKEHEEEARL